MSENRKGEAPYSVSYDRTNCEDEPIHLIRHVQAIAGIIVVAECKAKTLEPYLGLHYPASDIPPQARALYRKNRIRVITDVESKPAIVRYADTSTEAEPLDLSLATYRGCSPIHLEYLSNMGVRSSMSLAIIRDNQLWGLFACHHQSPIRIGYKRRNMLSLLEKVFSGQLQLLMINEYRERELAVEILRSELYERMSRTMALLFTVAFLITTSLLTLTLTQTKNG